MDFCCAGYVPACAARWSTCGWPAVSWPPSVRASPLAAALRAASGGRSGVRVGDPADLTVVAVDPSDVAPHDLRHIPVTATFLAGHPTLLP